MKYYFLDTNIVLDFLAKRPPFHEQCLKLFSMTQSKKCTLVTTDNAVTTTFFILKRSFGKEEALELTKSLIHLTDIEPVGKTELLQAFDLDFNDYEDAVQYCTALKHGKIDAIITINKKDFKNSQIPVFAPDEVVFE